jgi:Lamin Tail Domain
MSATGLAGRRKARMRLRSGGLDVLLSLVSILLGVLTLGIVLAFAACVPETDLSTLGPPGGPSGPATATAGTLVDPVAGSSEVPVNLAAVTLRFPGRVTLPPEAVHVCGGSAAGAPSAEPCEGGACYAVPLDLRLPAQTSCRVELGPGVTDEGGNELPAGLIGVFDTAAVADDVPPALSAVAIQVAGPCVAVTFATDEPATGTVILRAGDTETLVPAGVGTTAFDLAAPLASLPAATVATVTVRAVDRAGNVVESPALPFQTPGAIPPVVITEVLANAAGPEPAQEFVELRNLGAEPVPLDGLSIGDGRGSDALPAETLPPGAYALVVTSSYDPHGGADPAPRAGTLLLRVDARIGTDGLSNSGEVTRLLRGDEIISSYGGWVPVSSVAWSGKSVHRLVQTACDRPDAWSRNPLPPTPGWDAP